MVITPSSYDPFNNISFVQLNKQRRGELDRQPTGQRIYNNFYSPQTVRIKIKRNGDVTSNPKLFIWRKWKGDQLNDLLEEAGRHLGHEVLNVYNENGELIRHPSEIAGGRIYVFGGYEPFEYRTLTSINKMAPINQINTTQKLASLSRKHLYDVDKTANSDPPRVYSARLPTVSDDYPNTQINDDNDSRATKYTEEEISDMFADLESRDREIIAKHKAKFAGQRSESSNIFNRQGNIPYLIYVFLNGDGLKCQHINFTKSQIDRGMENALEFISQKFNVAPSKLVDLDGHRVRNIHQIVAKGAYVLIPFGQNFRETLYILPQNAIDTGTNMENIKERQIHQNKRFFRQKMKLPVTNQPDDTY